MHTLEILKANPSLFDFIKKMSRLAGRVNPLYKRLASDPRLYRPIKFIQVGANDGISCDPIREFVTEYCWRGVVVEPVLAIFSILKRSYARYPAVTPVNCAISYGGDRKLKLFCVSESALERYPRYASMISSVDPLHLTRLLPSISADEIVEMSVDCLTVEEVLERSALGSVDLLHLDVEGHEANILLNVDFSRVSPNYLLFEHDHISAEDSKKIEERLCEADFELERFTSDTLAVRHVSCPAK